MPSPPGTFTKFVKAMGGYPAQLSQFVSEKSQQASWRFGPGSPGGAGPSASTTAFASRTATKRTVHDATAYPITSWHVGAVGATGTAGMADLDGNRALGQPYCVRAMFHAGDGYHDLVSCRVQPFCRTPACSCAGQQRPATRGGHSRRAARLSCPRSRNTGGGSSSSWATVCS